MQDVRRRRVHTDSYVGLSSVDIMDPSLELDFDLRPGRTDTPRGSSSARERVWRGLGVS